MPGYDTVRADVNMSTIKAVIRKLVILEGLLLLAALALLRWMAQHMIVVGPMHWPW